MYIYPYNADMPMRLNEGITVALICCFATRERQVPLPAAWRHIAVGRQNHRSELKKRMAMTVPAMRTGTADIR